MVAKIPGAAASATFDEFGRARDTGKLVELVRGEIVEKPAPSAGHSVAQSVLSALLEPHNRHARGSARPGGWWILTEAEVAYPGTNEVFRHDLCGFLRRLHPEPPSGTPMRQRPEWVCEVVSSGTARVDLVTKQRTLHAHGVEHYWIVDPEAQTLSVFRREEEGYLLALASTTGETVSAEPFDELELAVGELFGHDE
jgi:Uma2 family endonuclease